MGLTIIDIKLPEKVTVLLEKQQKILDSFDYDFDSFENEIRLISEDCEISNIKQVKFFSVSAINADLEEIGSLGSKIVKNVLKLNGVIKIGIGQKGLKVIMKKKYFNETQSLIEETIRKAVHSHIFEEKK